jgi:hypothetical protein
VEQSIALAGEELAGRGLFLKRKAKGARVQLLKNQITEWETLLEKLNRTFGVHQAWTVGVWGMRRLERDEASKKFLTTESVRTVRASMPIGSVTVDGFMLPNGSYRMSQTQVAECVEKPEIYTRRFLDSKTLKSLQD